MTIETRARRAGAAARAAAGEGMDLMTASAQLPQEFDQRQRQRRNRLISAAAVAAILVAGAAIAVPLLTEDPAPPASSGAETATAAGLTVTIPDGWTLDEEFSDAAIMVLFDEPSQDKAIVTHGVSRVWDPATKALAPVPADFGAWLRANPSYEILSEAPATVAGQSTTTFLATPRSGYGDQVPLVEIAMSGFNPADAEYPGAQGEVVDLNPGERSYFTPVTVDGALVLVQTAFTPDLSAYQAVLASATTS